MGTARPFLKWAGGKHRVVDELMRLAKQRPLGIDWNVSSGERYHEPFLGSGAMYFGLKSRNFINTRKYAKLNDINSILINCMETVSNHEKLEKLERKLEKYQLDYAKQEPNPRGQSKDVRESRMYYKNRDKLNKLAKTIPNLSDSQTIELAALTIFLNKTCFNGLWRMNSNGEFNVPEGDYHAPTNIYQKSILEDCHKHLSSASLSTKTWQDTFSEMKTGDLVYLDPPYMPLELDGNTFTNYYTDGFSKDDQIELAQHSAQLAARGVRVIASNHDALGEPTVREIYGNAARDAGCRHKIERIEVSRNISCKGHGRVKVNEVLIFMSD